MTSSKIILTPSFKFLLKSKDVLHQVSSDMGEVNSFYSSFSDAGQKAPCLSKVRKSLPSISKKLRRNKEGYHHLSSPSTYLSTEFRNKETSSISYHPQVPSKSFTQYFRFFFGLQHGMVTSLFINFTTLTGPNKFPSLKYSAIHKLTTTYFYSFSVFDNAKIFRWLVSIN